MHYVLLLSVFVIATCGLIYELIASTVATYLLGDSVTQFSTVIGIYLFSMGIGAYLSKFINRNLIGTFIRVELLIGLVGGCSAAVLFLLFEQVTSFHTLLFTLIVIIGTLIGLELPLLMRILKERLEFKDLVSQLFTFDYIGALVASLLFPLVLVPHLGLVRSCFLFGILNILVALWTLYLFQADVPWAKLMKASGFGILVLMVAGFAYSNRLTDLAEGAIYPDPVWYGKSTHYQRIVLTRTPHDLRLYLNSNLQFSSRDEYRYHETLIHPGMCGMAAPRRVLVLGGGDGMAVREILKYPSIESIHLVDLDSEMTTLFSRQESLLQLNHRSLEDPKVHVVNEDAFSWLKKTNQEFDFIVSDFPDPSNYSIGKLYSTAFFRAIYEHLRPDGVFVVQCTSPLAARKSFWCINHTLQAVRFQTAPYHAYVPSFGEWGYIIASKQPFHEQRAFPENLRFINNQTAPALFDFPPDMQPLPTDVNRLNNQVLVKYFEEEWSEYAAH